MQHEFLYNSEIISDYNLTKYIFGKDESYFIKKDKAQKEKEKNKTQLVSTDNNILANAKDNVFLRASEFFNIKIHFMTGKIDKALEKRKYKNLFDFIVLGFNNNSNIFTHLKESLKNENESKIWMELPT